MRNLQKNKLLSELSTFKIGGPAAYFAEAETIEELQQLLLYANKESLPFHLVGKGSNSLFDDRGFDGLVILNKISYCDIVGEQISVGAGYSFSLLGTQTAKLNLSGLEFASGIPATVGGAIFMNAGALGGEVSTCLSSVIYIDSQGERRDLNKGELQFGYRFSSFQSMKGAIAGAIFELKFQTGTRERQIFSLKKRMETQPYKEFSCGCIFKNPERGKAAGALIESCGLKGKRIGGAAISDLHANFIVNVGGATAQDVEELIKQIQAAVQDQTGIILKIELRRIPFTC